MSEHGTRSRYAHGCRCEPCTLANREYSRKHTQRAARARKEMAQPLPGDVNHHGTYSSYCRGCRCTRCVEAQRENRRNRNNTPPPIAPVPLAPLLERVSSQTGIPVPNLTHTDIAIACRVSDRTVLRWMQTGTIKTIYADDIAIRLGWHPAAIWGIDWYIDTYDRKETA